MRRRFDARRVRLRRCCAYLAGGAGAGPGGEQERAGHRRRGQRGAQIAALGARCIFVGVVGNDDAGRRLTAELLSDPPIEVRVVVDPSRITTRKVRFVSEHFSTHLLSADWEEWCRSRRRPKIRCSIARSERGAVRLCQGPADPAPSACLDRWREKTRQAGDRGSEGQGFFNLSGRDPDHAQPA